MKLSEPVTAITDFILTAECVAFAYLLLARSNGKLSVLLWACAFLALAAGALSGGLFHGLRHSLSPASATALWRITAFSLIVGFLLFAAGGSASAARGPARTILLSVCLIAILGTTAWAARRNVAAYEIRGSRIWIGLILVSLSILLARQILGGGAASGIHILIGSWICILGIGIQQAKFQLGKHVNQNDICHVLFFAGLYFLYLGGQAL